MYSILFHVGWLALIEIVFYFEYIGPLETQLFKESINNILKNYKNENNYNENILIINPYNHSQIIYVNETNILSKNYNNVNNAEKERLNDNYKLYSNTLLYWFYFCLTSLIICFIFLYYQYYKFESNKKKKINSITSTSDLKIEIIEKQNLSYFFEEVSENKPISPSPIKLNNNNEVMSPRSNQMNIIQKQRFFIWDKIKKKCLEKIVHSFGLGFCIIFFEYLFFNYIVLNYKVISDEEMVYLISKLIHPIFHNIYKTI